MDKSLVGSEGRRNTEADSGFVRVRGAREHNLKDVDARYSPGCAGGLHRRIRSGKSSLAFGTLYAEAQRRYLESVSPYARRLFHQMAVPRGRSRSTGCRRPWRCSSSAARRRRVPRSAASRHCPICCGCSTRARATIRPAAASRCGGVFAEHAGGRLPELPWPRPRL